MIAGRFRHDGFKMGERTTDPLAVARAGLQPDADKDGAADFKRCWPTGAHLAGFDAGRGAVDGETACVVYAARTANGQRVRKCAVHTLRGGKPATREVDCGWEMWHEAPAGGFIAPSGAGGSVDASSWRSEGDSNPRYDF